MKYSVWDQGAGLYNYYEDKRVQTTLNTPAPDHITQRALGSTVTQAAWPLPPDAKKVGQGDVAIGRVAAAPGSLFGLGDSVVEKPLVKAGMLTAAAILIYKFVAKGGRR